MAGAAIYLRAGALAGILTAAGIGHHAGFIRHHLGVHTGRIALAQHRERVADGTRHLCLIARLFHTHHRTIVVGRAHEKGILARIRIGTLDRA